MISKNELEKDILGFGADLVGTSNVSMFLDEKLKNTPYCITIGVALSYAIISDIETKPTYMYYGHYRMVNSLLNEIAMKTGKMIEKMGYNYRIIPASQSVNDKDDEFTGDFQHKTGARLSGLGFIGKSALLINEKYGPRVRYVSVLTDMKVESSSLLLESKCKECRECVKYCPALAIKGPEYSIGKKRNDLYDARACSKYMKDNFMGIGRGSVCGICIKVCPFGQKKRHP